MTLQETISSLLDNDSKTLDPQWVEEVLEQYPYFTLPALMLLSLNKEADDEVKARLVQRL